MIKLTTFSSGKPIYVNPEHVSFVVRSTYHNSPRYGDPCTQITTMGGGYLVVEELPEEVVELCQKSS